MSEWKAKRFWKETAVTTHDTGFGVALDGRPVKTPAKAPLHLPTRALAEAVAAEWEAQEGEIDPTSMPATRAANSAIDRVAPQRAAVAEMLAAYGDSDLLCYRADAPEALVARQAETWDPLLDWAEETFGARLEPRSGVMHAPQDPEALARLAARVEAMDAFELAGFHDLVSLSGSLVIGLAAFMGAQPVGDLWAASRLDELWQEEHWGPDEEAREQAEIKRVAFFDSKRFCDLLGTD